MRDYHGKRREREPLVREIYGLGLSAHEIAQITPWSQATLAQDIRRLGRLKAFTDRPKKKDDVFAAVIRRYAQIVFTDMNDKGGEPDEPRAQIRVALATWLREDLILAMLHGLEFTLEQLTVPSFPPERKNHARLLGVILGVVVGDPCDAESWPFTGTKNWWHNMLVAIVAEEETAPKSLKHLCKMLVRRVLSDQRTEIMPIWDDKVFTHVDQMIATLHPRQQDVIQKLFGINCERQTSEQIGEYSFVTRERIRQIEAKALHKLRQEARVRKLGIVGKPVGNALQYELARREAIEVENQLALKQLETTDVEAQPSLEDDARALLTLTRNVEEFDLSIRTANCLQNANIVFIGDLVQCSEVGLLKIRNFGRKSLREIKEILYDLGLILCMNRGLPIIQTFHAWRERQSTS